MGFRAARKRAGRGLTETAKHVGVSRQAVNLWERGVNEPSISTLRILAAFYECTIDELLAPDEAQEVSRDE